MATKKMSGDNNATIRFAVENYFDGNISQAAERTGYTQSQIKKWINDEIRPHVDTTRYFMSIALIPEFTIVCEHHPFNGTESISNQLKTMLNGHHNSPGIYVFYDSLCEPIYLGKANTSLQTEITSALNRAISLSYPKTIFSPPAKVKELVKYISAYDVAGKEHSDYPKHVESLVLRINKPKLNKQLGTLTKLIPKKPDE
ncbi:hypothetical protein ACMSYW_001292 [Cronobacter dublinensis]|nr:hypothetical protein [Cronobacter sakazakii]